MIETTSPLAPPAALTPAARRILAAAGELFYDQGIGAVGVDAVASAAGTTKKTIYDRFGSKEALVVAYLRARHARWRQFVLDHVEASDRTGAERPLAVLDALEAWMASSTRGCGFTNAYAELSGSPHRGVEVVHAEKAWVRDLYAELTDDPGVAARLALVHEGAIVALTAGAQPDAIDVARATFLALLRT